MREIKFVEPINSVCFLGGERDIIVGHSGNLSRLNYVDYKNEKMVVKEEEYKNLRAKSDPIDADFFSGLISKEGVKPESKTLAREVKPDRQELLRRQQEEKE